MTEDELHALKIGRSIKDMMETQGWAAFIQILEGRLEAERMRLEAPAVVDGHFGDGLSRVLEKEAVCGGIMMLKFVMQMPNAAVETAEAIIRENRRTDDAD